MYQINNKKFGSFIARLRKEKNLTQKDLAERLFVSDKTVSKWERGISFPNVGLLIPISDILGVSVTELLYGENIDTEKNLNLKEFEKLKSESPIDFLIKKRQKHWRFTYLLCFFISIVEMIGLILSGILLTEAGNDIFWVSLIMLLFGAWFCFFAKDTLPIHYDHNKINYVSQGIFKIHLVGLSFNNGNWSYLCTTFKIWALTIAVLYPLAGILTIHYFSITIWKMLKNFLLPILLGGFIASIYIVGKKYE